MGPLSGGRAGAHRTTPCAGRRAQGGVSNGVSAREDSHGAELGFKFVGGGHLSLSSAVNKVLPGRSAARPAKEPALRKTVAADERPAAGFEDFLDQQPLSAVRATLSNPTPRGRSRRWRRGPSVFISLRVPARGRARACPARRHHVIPALQRLAALRAQVDAPFHLRFDRHDRAVMDLVTLPRLACAQRTLIIPTRIH